MQESDPWKSHAGLMPLVAMLAPEPVDLVLWLQLAHKATGSNSDSPYAGALRELLCVKPPWLQAGPDGINLLSRAVHEESWSKVIRRDQMHMMLQDVANDAEVKKSQATKLAML